jgi:uncharacterized protein (TIGR04255 family)
VSYERPALRRVICQLRFPAVLKIEADVPSEFQERIRDLLPLAERVDAAPAQLPISHQIADVLAGAASTTAYAFSSEDQSTSIELRSTALTFQTKAYRHWADLLAILMPALEALESIYRPPFYSRIGLRYINSINRASLGIKDTPWSQLFNQFIAGELEHPLIEQNIEAIEKSVRVRNKDRRGGFFLHHGIISEEANDTQSYSIDFDFYVDERTETQNVHAVLGNLHGRAGRAWRWCITPTLEHVLGARPI